MKAAFKILKPRIFVISLFFFILNLSNSYGQFNADTTILIDETKIDGNNWDRFTISAGGFFTSNNSNISIGSQKLGLGININIEEVLGLETSTFAFRSEANYRFGKTRKHSIMIGYFGVYRNAQKVLKKELIIGNQVFSIGTDIISTFDLSIVRLKYDYAFLQNKYVSIGASIGFYIMPISFSIRVGKVIEEATSFIAPLPVLGLRTEFLLTEKFYLRQSTELLLISIDNFKGRILDLDISLEHRTFKNFSFGLGINSNHLVITAKGKDYPNIDFYGTVEMEYLGAYIFVKYRF